MSVQASCSYGSQIPMNRHKILLTDVELAKKNEWNRRRRLRLQQVRQQANDLASTVRAKVQCEKERNTLAEKRRLSAEEKKWQERELRKLQTHYKACLLENGIAQEKAKQQIDKEALVQQHRELLSELTKTRCHIAVEKQKAEEVMRNEKKEAADRCRELAKNVENLRANLIASLPPPCCQRKPMNQPGKPREPNYDSVLSQKSGSNAPSKKSTKVSFRGKSPNKKKPPSSSEPQVIVVSPLSRKKTSDRSPPKRSQFSFNGKYEDTPMACSLKSYQCKYSRGKYSISDCEDSNSEDSDDSNGTWPLYSPGRRRTPPKVQVYDHAGKQCYEYAQPLHTVTPIDPNEYEDVGTNTIIEEEKRYCDSRPKAAKRQTERGRMALSKERLRREFDEMIRDLSKLDRKERMERIQQNSFPSRLCMSRERRKQREQLRQVRLENAFKSYIDLEYEPTGYSPGKYNEPGCSNIASRVAPGCPLEGIGQLLHGRGEGGRPLVESENALKILLERLRREKEELLVEQEKKKEGVERAVGRDLVEEEQELDDVEIPTWIHHVETESSSSREVSPSRNQVRVDVEVSPGSTRKKSPGKSKRTSPSSPRKESPKANKKSPKKVGISPKKASPSQKSPKSGSPNKSPQSPKRKPVDKSPIVEEGKSSKNSSPTHNDDTTCGALSLTDDSSFKSNNVSFEGIKVIVKVRDRSPKPIEEEPMTPCKRLSDATSSGSSSYLSPPDRLNPTQREMLNSVLANIDLKNKNPSLHQYITRLLSMSRESVDALSVSVSDVSFRSELITAQNTPEKKNVATEVKIEKATSSVGLQTTDSPKDRRFTDLAEMYSQRINALANMVDHFNSKSTKNFDETSYLSIPSQLDTSVKMSESIKKAAKASFYPRSEDTFTSNYRGVQTDKYVSTRVQGQPVSPQQPLNREDVAALGLRMDILPKPEILNEHVNTAKPKVRPPTSLQNNRRMPAVNAHELSTIIEADTPGTSGVQSNLYNRERLSPIPHSEQSFHSMPSDIDSDLSSIPTLSPQRITVTTTVEPGPSGWSPNKKKVDLDESGNSSLSIISNMSDCLLSDRQRAREKSAPNSSSDDFEDVFQSLGIGWALATLRKTKEAKQLSLNSSSSSPKDQKKGEKSTSHSKGSSKYMHSTPVKKPVKSPVKSGKKSGQTSSFGSEVSSVSGSKSCKNDSLSLTPPSLTLVTPYLNFNLQRGKTDDFNQK